ncbi:F0F1 ATP synthase subunit delta [Paludifilum halophilum]|uniref:ATP synthase subunit delta n=1 Tax=Paludifilum halophilum TaxID=1642702 RepID=A0A235B6S6_9BACL|nr:F0F1 ATP synthase subunit delta [Paludifilum halophilum]OYD08008.1 hypothetical protein CHM34_07790 [Paludifilum halophilum]
MSQTIVAKRYARALFQAASERKKTAEVGKEWSEVAAAVNASKELRAWLADSVVTADQKKEVLHQLFPKLSELPRNLLFLLIDRRREGLIQRIETEYTALVHESEGVAEAEVITAQPLKKKEEKELAKVFQQRIGKKLVITNRVDAEILGGIIVKVGDRLYDGSLSGKLDRFRKQLAESRVG